MAAYHNTPLKVYTNKNTSRQIFIKRHVKVDPALPRGLNHPVVEAFAHKLRGAIAKRRRELPA